jgi:cyclin-dependent kinase regulatory subunit CKS1
MSRQYDYFNAPPSLREDYYTIISKMSGKIVYSERYSDETHTYRHVKLPQEYKPLIPERLMTEQEIAALGVTQSTGWTHYMIHKPEPCVLCFRRALDEPKK